MDTKIKQSFGYLKTLDNKVFEISIFDYTNYINNNNNYINYINNYINNNNYNYYININYYINNINNINYLNNNNYTAVFYIPKTNYSFVNQLLTVKFLQHKLFYVKVIKEHTHKDLKILFCNPIQNNFDIIKEFKQIQKGEINVHQ